MLSVSLARPAAWIVAAVVVWVAGLWAFWAYLASSCPTEVGLIEARLPEIAQRLDFDQAAARKHWSDRKFAAELAPHCADVRLLRWSAALAFSAGTGATAAIIAVLIGWRARRSSRVSVHPSPRLRWGRVAGAAFTVSMVTGGAVAWFGSPLVQRIQERAAVAAVSTAHPEVADDTALAMQGSSRGFDRAITALERQATPAAAEAMLPLARLCARADGLACMRWLATSDRSSPSAQRDWRTLALQRAKARAGAGDAEGMAALAEMLFDGEGIAKDVKEALRWAVEAARSKPVEYAVPLARRLTNGYTYPRNLALAVDLAEQASRAPMAPVDLQLEASRVVWLAALQARKDKLSQSEIEYRAKQRRIVERAASTGDASALYELADITWNDDQTAAMALLHRAAPHGQSLAMAAVAALAPVATDKERALSVAWRQAIPVGDEDQRRWASREFVSAACTWFEREEVLRRRGDRLRREAWCDASMALYGVDRSEQFVLFGVGALTDAVVAAAKKGEAPTSLPNPYEGNWSKSPAPVAAAAKAAPKTAVAPAVAPSVDKQATAPAPATGASPAAAKPVEPWKADDGRNDPERGLSTFTVDNTQGAGDAWARLYRGGKAVRTIEVRNGQQATMRELAPGDYVMRYKFVATGKVYEAEQVFSLTETRNSEGTRYSTVRVTLYKVAAGNLKTKEVPPERF